MIDICLCFSYSDVCRHLSIPINGTGIRKAKNYCIENKLDTSHFDPTRTQKLNSKYKKIKKLCPVCNTLFETTNSKKEKMTCSYSCSNSHFRQGPKNGKWNEDAYRSTCFLYHKKECIICGEDKIVSVHHFDENHQNNNPKNLVPLCPTHHQYIHSSFRDLIYDKVKEYVLNFESHNSLGDTGSAPVTSPPQTAHSTD